MHGNIAQAHNILPHQRNNYTLQTNYYSTKITQGIIDNNTYLYMAYIYNITQSI